MTADDSPSTFLYADADPASEVQAGRSSPASLLRLRVATDGDPSVLPRLFGLFQNLNITPRRVEAQFAGDTQLHLAIDLFGVTEDRLTLIAAKVGQHVSVLNAYWHHLA